MALVILRNGQRADSAGKSGQAGFDGLEAGFRAGWLRRCSMDPLPVRKAAARSKTFCLENSTDIVEVLGRLFTRKVRCLAAFGARSALRAWRARRRKPRAGTAQVLHRRGHQPEPGHLEPDAVPDPGRRLDSAAAHRRRYLRHDISLAVKERIYQAAFVVLVVFFAFIIFNDVTKLPIFNHVKP